MKQIHPYDLYDLLHKAPIVQVVKRDGRQITSNHELGSTTNGTVIEIDGELHEVTTTVPPSPTCSLQ